MFIAVQLIIVFIGLITLNAAKSSLDSVIWMVRFIASATACIISASHHVP
jgi:hypothetical protein